MVRTLVCVALLAVTSALLADDVADRIASIEARSGGRIGVAALDTGSSKRVEYRSTERFPMCSTFKLLAAAAILQRVDRKQEQLDRFVPYGEKDILEYAPVAKQHLKDGGMRLAALCQAAIEQSDNTAGNLLLDAIGGPVGLTNFARSLGDQVTRLDRKEPELNSAMTGDDRDTTTPASMQADLLRLLTGDALSQSSRQQLEDWLQGNTTGASMIRSGMPAIWKVGDKTGRCGNGATNDVAILRPPNRAPILVAIYTIGSSAPSNERDTVLAKLAKIVSESL
jgi:beta-lactamase class A